MAEQVRLGVYRHHKGHLYEVLFLAWLHPYPLRSAHTPLMDALDATNGPTWERRLRLAVVDGLAVAFPLDDDYSVRPSSVLTVVYVGLTLDGNPRPGPRTRVRTAAQFAEVLLDGRRRFEWVAPEWTPGIA